MVNHQKNRYEHWTPETYRDFEELYEVSTKDQCWLWTGAVVNGSSSPCPVFAPRGGANKSAALYVYDIVIGLPKSNKYIKTVRTCTEHLCVNPYHREVKLYDHPKKRLGARKKHKKKTECRNGHDVSRPNARNKSGECKECKKVQNAKYREKHGSQVSKMRQKPWDEAARELLDRY